jgi:hypothetical protein
LTAEDREWNEQINPLSAYAKGNLRGIQGAGNEQLVAARALKHGFIVFFKMWSDTKYDMVMDCEGELFRVQIKGTQTGVISLTGGLRGGIQKPISKERYYTRDDCDIIIGVDANNGNCYVLPIDYATALGKKSVRLNEISKFLERWDYITGNKYLTTAQCRTTIPDSELRNMLRQILSTAKLPADTNELRKLFYENCPQP